MLKMNVNEKSFSKIDRTDLIVENLLERYDLQQCIYNSWDCFKNEIGLQNSILIGQEILPHSSVLDSIDLLALDLNDSSITVIELKRNKNKFQLLQSLSYAAMISDWTVMDLADAYKYKNNEIDQESLDLIKSIDLNKNIKIIMLAEKYDPEVILTSNWLADKDVSIKAFSIKIHKYGDDLLFDIDQKFPLPELSEIYHERRSKTKLKKDVDNNIQWKDLIPGFKYDFAEEAINLCRKVKGNEGDPSRRRFVNIISSENGLKSVTIYFRNKYINVGAYCDDKQEKIALVKENLGEEVEASEWDGGITFQFNTENVFDKFTKWMKLI